MRSNMRCFGDPKDTIDSKQLKNQIYLLRFGHTRALLLKKKDTKWPFPPSSGNWPICSWCISYMYPSQKEMKTINFSLICFFLVCQIAWTNSFCAEGSANTEHITRLFKIESCSDSKVDEEGNEHSHWQRLLLWKRIYLSPSYSLLNIKQTYQWLQALAQSWSENVCCSS